VATLAAGHRLLDQGQAYEGLAAFTKAVHHCPRDRNVRQILEAEVNRVREGDKNTPVSPHRQWVCDTLVLALAVTWDSPEARQILKARAIRRKSFRQPVVIVAGGAEAWGEDATRRYELLLLKAFEGFRGTIVSGGTTSGIPGVVGAIAEVFTQKEDAELNVMAYLPKRIPENTRRDGRYTELLEIQAEEFSPAQPLQNWIDLIAAGIRPEDVAVLGINGGPIAAFEYRLALALGANVGLVASSGRAAAEVHAERDAWEGAKLLWLPEDAMTLRAFIVSARSKGEEIPSYVEPLAEAIHNRFLAERRHDPSDPVMTPWDRLRDDLKESCRDQAAYAVEILRAAGYRMQPATAAESVTIFAEEEIERMAEMEHGRWNVERLKAGWKYGSRRDPAARTSPYLCAWTSLADEIREQDRSAVRNWPSVFSQAGIAVTRLIEP